MNSRDIARVGLLYLQSGMWEGRRILSERWIERIRSSCDLNYMYGCMWWLQHDQDGRQVSFTAQGGGSHQCFVIPDHDLVIVVRRIRNDSWEELLDLALRLVNGADELGPLHYDFALVNRPPGAYP